MWIVSQLPLFVTQTICTIPRSGGDPTQPGVNALQHNFVDNLIFVSTETLDVEYGVGSLKLDHWAFGPHHVWTDPATGLVVRMWQPAPRVDRPRDGVGGANVAALQWLARTKKPLASYTGDNFASMSSVLNKWLLREVPNSRSCDEFSVEELERLQIVFFIHIEGSRVECRPQRHLRRATRAA